jgi:hypothetical protein
VLEHPGARPKGKGPQWTPQSLAHPSTEEHDDTVEAHYASLERLCPHACIRGWVFVGYIDEYGEERSLLRLPPLR